MAFKPASVQIKRGDVVLWAFEDGTVKHSVSGPGFTSPIETTGNYAVTFSSPGVFPYHDRLHPQMKGKVVVTK
jgi:plastocyanin